jgi:hypothetical protein
VRPRVDAVFHRDEKMGVYFKAYNFGADGERRAPSGQVEYDVVQNGSGKTVSKTVDDLSQVEGAALSQVTIKKFFDLKNFAPGPYTVWVRITDKARNEMATRAVVFTVI